MDDVKFLYNDIHAFLETNKTLKNENQDELKQKIFVELYVSVFFFSGRKCCVL